MPWTHRTFLVALPLASGAIFLSLWIAAEFGRGLTGLGLMSLLALAMMVSRWMPALSLGLAGVALVAQALGLLAPPDATDWAVYFGIPLTIGLVAISGRGTVRWIALASGPVASLACAALMVIRPDGWMSWIGARSGSPALGVQSFLAISLVGTAACALAWGSGFGLSAAARLLETERVTSRMEHQLQESEVELAVAQERNRIAQEMHDVLAHSLAVVIAQADGARFIRAKRPQAVDAALESIAESARSALSDVRAIIDGILDGSDAPSPGVDDIGGLVDGMRSTGLSLTVVELGERQPLAALQELAVFRIVQECLTNSLRHRGRDSTAVVVFDWRGQGVSILVESSGGSVAADPPTRIGRGVIGMRERAHVAGGWLNVGTDDAGIHRVSAFIPFYFAQFGVRELVAS